MNIYQIFFFKKEIIELVISVWINNVGYEYLKYMYITLYAKSYA